MCNKYSTLLTSYYERNGHFQVVVTEARKLVRLHIAGDLKTFFPTEIVSLQILVLPSPKVVFALEN